MIAPKASSTAALVPVDQLRKLLSDPADGIIDRLAKAGRIAPPDDQGRIDLIATLPAFFAELRDQMRAGTATAASERARLARAASQELRLAEARRELIPTEDCEAAVDHLCGAILTTNSGLPARITRDVPLRRRIEAALHEMQAALARDLQGL
jgi:hypothetical protein